MNVLSIPFRFEKIASTIGFLKIRTDHLHIEYETQQVTFVKKKSSIKTLEISYQDIGDIQYKSNWFRTKIMITVNSLAAVSALGSYSANINFIIQSTNKHIAEEFTDNLRLHVAEHQLKLLEGHTTDKPKLLGD